MGEVSALALALKSPDPNYLTLSTLACRAQGQYLCTWHGIKITSTYFLVHLNIVTREKILLALCLAKISVAGALFTIQKQGPTILGIGFWYCEAFRNRQAGCAVSVL